MKIEDRKLKAQNQGYKMKIEDRKLAANNYRHFFYPPS